MFARHRRVDPLHPRLLVGGMRIMTFMLASVSRTDPRESASGGPSGRKRRDIVRQIPRRNDPPVLRRRRPRHRPGPRTLDVPRRDAY